MACRGISGTAGRVQVDSCNVFDLTAWELNYGSDPQTFFPASTAPAQSAVSGTEGGTGSFTLAIDPNDPPGGDFGSGDEVVLELRHNTSGSVKATGSAIIGQISSGADLSGQPQLITYNFTTCDQWTLP